MNWVTKLYFAEGPGIEKDAPKPTGLRLLLSVLVREWWTLIQLNVLFIAFSLPLVTLPAAWSATVSVSVKMLEDRNIWLLRDFWSAFRSRFVASTAIGLAAIGTGALGYLAVTTYAQKAAENIAFAAPLAIAAAILIALPLFVSQLFVALALKDDLSIIQIAKAAALGLLVNPLGGLAALAFVAVIWFAHIAFYPASVLLPVLVNFSLSALVLSFAAHGGIQFGLSHATAKSRTNAVGKPESRSA